MKEIKQECVTYTTRYEAFDGTTFTDKTQCLKYEETAECVIKKKFLDIVKYKDSECSIFGCGSDDYIIEFVKVDSDEIATIIMQILELSHNNDERARALIERAKNTKDYLLIGHNEYDDNYYYAWDTREGILTNIEKNLFFENKKEEE